MGERYHCGAARPPFARGHRRWKQGEEPAVGGADAVSDASVSILVPGTMSFMAAAVGETLRSLCQQWRAARGQPGQDAANARQSAVRGARRLIQSRESQAEAKAWFAATLEGSEREPRFFAAAALDGVTPKRLLGSMITAAVNEPNPSFNRSFVRPALRCAGPARVMGALIRIFREGQPSERTGALAALYWATADASKFSSEAQEVPVLGQAELLDTFLATEHLPLRRQILPWLGLGTPMADELAGRIARVTEICRASSDEYLRTRVRVQLGESSLLPALPAQSS